ncbi:MAG TPA: purine-nucleoside phosphorylase [Halanaerobiales bacterium]|nr:purine-nucleoside phosphorylase [Halanaerobiales bacterium]
MQEWKNIFKKEFKIFYRNIKKEKNLEEVVNMTVHIGAEKGEIADTILLPGDPMRAKFIAENYLEDIECYNEVRGMLGYTGKYNGNKISVQGTGMGMPSISIYANELIKDYGVQNLVRVGSCGSINENAKLRDVILAGGASTTSGMNEKRFNGGDYAPTPDFNLLLKAYKIAQENGTKVKVGDVLSEDKFYHDNPDHWKKWAKYGVMALEMETAELYTLAAKYDVNALSILTVSDSIISGEELSAGAREKTFTDMMEIALKLA